MKEFDGIYKILDHIGRGSYASVHKAINRQTGEVCAIKKIPVRESDLTNLINEINIMSGCQCRNIVRFLASACSDREVSIVMEYCCGGSVKDVMLRLGRTITQEQIIVITKDVLTGLDYLHSKNRIHRDVKAANILLSGDGIAKLGDFGVSEPLYASGRKVSIMGTILWLPPEVVNQDPIYSPVIDIWSLGITVIEMGDGQPPYNELSEKAALKEIANHEKPAPTFRDPKNWLPSLNGFLSLCLEKNASIRKGAKELLNYELFENAPSNDIIRSLVNEVCTSTRRGGRSGSKLHERSECLIGESEVLLDIYRDRRKKEVTKMNHLTESLKSVGKSFKELQDYIMRRDSEIYEMRTELENLVTEFDGLKREKCELMTTLAGHKQRRSNILEMSNKCRMKLKSLEGKIT